MSDGGALSHAEAPRTTCDVEANAEGLSFGMMTVVVPPGSSTEAHEHASQELWVIQQGRGRVVMPDVELPLAPGPATAIPANTPHAVHCEGDEQLVLLAFWWKRR
jgi:mannose-6-phosphate isomerase-like protein (cupin superfamily)